LLKIGVWVFVFVAISIQLLQAQSPKVIKQKLSNMSTSSKMQVEVWSDVMCPFCYIGKRKFEAAQQQFAGSDSIEIVWKSYQLQPDLISDPTKNTIEHLAESKGWTMDYTKQTVSHVVNMAQQVGLAYNFDKAVVANSFDAHRLSHYATQHGKGDAMEEQLFKAYFTDGKNTASHEVLTQLAVAIGLNESSVKEVLASNQFADEVRHDIYEASQIGVKGVPFFVFNRKYAVSGAQDTQVFLDTLKKAFGEWKQANEKSVLEVRDGAVCTPDGECK
jgi:predicted DsbA family dithiol-disulfide isomerase